MYEMNDYNDVLFTVMCMNVQYIVLAMCVIFNVVGMGAVHRVLNTAISL